MKTCLSNDIEVFTTKGLKEWLKEQGCTYNVDYEVNAFSNAITYLIKKHYILPTGEKGKYKVVKKEKEKEKVNCNNIDEQNEEKKSKDEYVPEKALEEMRRKIKEYIANECKELEEILDSEKPSVYGKNKKTYNDILELITYLQNFKFSVEK